MAKLGKIENVAIRKVWKLETDFSDWLAGEDRLEELSAAIGVDLIDAKREEGVGDFSADILASEDGTDRKVIIENQYGRTNHDHLGKLITYASGTGAKTVIWIVEEAREEHRSAIQWLNEVSEADIGFFLVRITLLRIGDSEPAPQFTVLERPNDWAKATKEHSSGHGARSETRVAQQRFFEGFLDYALERKDFAALYKRVKAQPQHWLDLPLGSSAYHLALTAISGKKHGFRLGVEVYIGNSKEQYQTFANHKEEIEKEIGEALEWMALPEKKASRVRITKPLDWTDAASLPKCYSWLTDLAVRFKKVFPRFDA